MEQGGGAGVDTSECGQVVVVVTEEEVVAVATEANSRRQLQQYNHCHHHVRRRRIHYTNRYQHHRGIYQVHILLVCLFSESKLCDSVVHHCSARSCCCYCYDCS